MMIIIIIINIICVNALRATLLNFTAFCLHLSPILRFNLNVFFVGSRVRSPLVSHRLNHVGLSIESPSTCCTVRCSTSFSRLKP